MKFIKKNEENIEYGILDYLSDFPDNIIFFFDSTQHMAQVAKYLKDVEKDLRNGSNKYYQYLLEALPVFCTYSNEENYESNVNLNSQIYTIIPRKETVTRTRNIKVTKELGNYINNFLYKLFLKYDDIIDEESNILSIFIDSCKEQERKEEINKTIGSKYKYFCEKFTECPPYKPNTWLYFECLLLSVFSYFLDITFDIEFEEATKWSSKETKESLLNKAINAIIKPQINGIEEFEKFFNQLKNIDNFGEKILLEKPEGEAVKQFLNDEFTIGFVKETIENKKKRKILYLKKIELEKMLSDNNIDKNKFLEHMYSKQIVKVNKDGEKIRYDIKTSFKNYSSQERFILYMKFKGKCLGMIRDREGNEGNISFLNITYLLNLSQFLYSPIPKNSERCITTMFLSIFYLYYNIAIRETVSLIFLFFAIVTGLILSCSNCFNMVSILVLEK